jgi:plasmid maintenance system killer protein
VETGGLPLIELEPSVAAGKKYEGADNVWQGRVNRDWRFYFKIIGSKYHLVDITPHPK